MKHIKIFETKFRSPGLRNKNVGRYLTGIFFKKDDVSSVIETQTHNGYLIEIVFENLNGSIFENLVNIKNVLLQDYNVTYDNITINSRNGEEPHLEIFFISDDNIDKLKEDAILYKTTKKYNI